jgi:undecaprenyl-diphosphatase
LPLFHILVLAVVQGITEFLPISSHAHLRMLSGFAGWSEGGLVLDVAVHVGTLGAVIIYFRRDIAAILSGLAQFLLGRNNPGARLGVYVGVATIPVLIAGFLIRGHIDAIGGLTVIGWTTLIFGWLLYAVDRFGLTVRRVEHLKLSDALCIGIAQVCALVPGVSRSGVTMTAARYLGFERAEAARFSMLLSIPAILGAGAATTFDLVDSGNWELGLDALLGAALAFFTALLAITVLMSWLRRASFTPFVVYRTILGLGLLAWVYL